MSFVINPGTIQPPLTAGGVAYGTGSSAKVSAAGTPGQVLQSNGASPPTFVTFSGGVTSVGMTVPSVFSVSGSPITSSGTLAVTYSGTALPIANGGTGTATPSLVQGCGITITGSWPNQTITSAVPAAKTCTFNASGTWTKPSGYGTTARVLIQAWGGGGSGSRTDFSSAGGGGGGGFNYRWMPIACLASTVTVTIGAGGAARVCNACGQTGGTSSFGTHVSAWGGGGGVAGGSTGGTGGGGGGQLSSGGAPTAGTPNACTFPFYVAAATRWVNYEGAGAIYSSLLPGWNAASSGYYKGGGGGGGNGTQAFVRNAAGSVWGGGGGGGTKCYSEGTGGVSSFGGNGGRSGSCRNGVAGTQPGGGGGAAMSNSTSGAGGDGRVVVTVFAGV